jgi:hypothetical protein
MAANDLIKDDVPVIINALLPNDRTRAGSFAMFPLPNSIRGPAVIVKFIFTGFKELVFSSQ